MHLIVLIEFGMPSASVSGKTCTLLLLDKKVGVFQTYFRQTSTDFGFTFSIEGFEKKGLGDYGCANSLRGYGGRGSV